MRGPQFAAVSLAVLLLVTPSVPAAVELEVRATQGNAPVTDLSASDFSLRHNGDDMALNAAEYVDDVAGTKVYIAVQVPGGQLARVMRAVEQFLTDGLPDGVEVSLGGTPFTSDKAKLLEYLEAGAAIPSATPDGGMIRLWSAEPIVQVQGRQVIRGYRALSAQLGQLPGRKVVALFRPWLRLRSDGLDTRATTIRSGQLRQNDSDIMRNQAELEAMASQAILSRTSFYTAVVTESVDAGADFGMTSLARLSGGRALSGGEPGRLFEMLLQDSAGYYVLNYNPDLRGDSQQVSLRVNTSRKGVNVRSVRKFIDIPAVSGAAQAPDVLSLDPAGAKLSLTTAIGYLRGPDGKPRAVFTAAIPVNELESEDAKKAALADLTLGGGVPGGDGEFVASKTVRTQQKFDKKAFARAQRDPSILVDVSAMVDLEAPGTHPWKLVLRDEASGRYGVSTEAPGAPDFSLPLATSTIFLSRRAVEINADTPAQPWGDALDFGPSRVIPEATRTFKVGETVLFSYTLYNPTAEMLQTAPPVQIALLQNEQQIDGFDVNAQNMIDSENKTIRYVGGLNTKGLPPANYIILSAVPGRNDARQPYVEAKFTLVK